MRRTKQRSVPLPVAAVGFRQAHQISIFVQQRIITRPDLSHRPASSVFLVREVPDPPLRVAQGLPPPPPAPEGIVNDMGEYCLRPPLAVSRLTREGQTLLARAGRGVRVEYSGRPDGAILLRGPQQNGTAPASPSTASRDVSQRFTGALCARTQGRDHMETFCQWTGDRGHELLPKAEYRLPLVSELQNQCRVWQAAKKGRRWILSLKNTAASPVADLQACGKPPKRCGDGF